MWDIILVTATITACLVAGFACAYAKRAEREAFKAIKEKKTLAEMLANTRKLIPDQKFTPSKFQCSLMQKIAGAEFNDKTGELTLPHEIESIQARVGDEVLSRGDRFILAALEYTSMVAPEFPYLLDSPELIANFAISLANHVVSIDAEFPVGKTIYGNGPQ